VELCYPGTCRFENKCARTKRNFHHSFIHTRFTQTILFLKTSRARISSKCAPTVPAQPNRKCRLRSRKHRLGPTLRFRRTRAYYCWLRMCERKLYRLRLPPPPPLDTSRFFHGGGRLFEQRENKHSISQQYCERSSHTQQQKGGGWGGPQLMASKKMGLPS